jgi:phage tail sheath protein FI
MVQVSYPGVYIEERSSGVRTITGVATSIAAFIDSFPRGLLNEAVQCLSYADFEREFGGIDANSPASYGIKQFFQNGGGEAWVVRVATLEGEDEQAVEARAVLMKVAGGADVLFRLLAGRRIRGEVATNPGTWGNNIFVEITHETSDPTTFNLLVSETVTENGRARLVRSETFRNLTMDPAAPNHAIDVVNEGSLIVQIDRHALDGGELGALTPPFTRPPATGTMGNALLTVEVPGDGTVISVKVTDDTDDEFDETGELSYGGTVPETYQGLRPFLEAAIRKLASTENITESQRALLAGASVKLLGTGSPVSPFRFLVQGGRAGTAYRAEAKIHLAVDDAKNLGFPVVSPVPPEVQQHRLAGGLNGKVPVEEPALLGSPALKTGIYALEDVDLFNILCIPRAADLTDATSMRAVYDQAGSYASGRRAFLLVDIPETTATLDGMETWLRENDSLRSKEAAVYFPRTFVPDPVNQNRLKSLAASGTIAGLYARTDASRGVWKAPAGTEATLQNVQGLAYLLTDLQNGALNPLGVNCLRTFPVFGHVSWGARTLDGADQLSSEWKYIPIRRLALFIEESLFRGTKYAVFEPNDESLWAQIRLNIGVFMNGLFRQGAFQGQTPQEAYFVKCDKETTTQADRNLGTVNIEVGFAPLKPAEFVVIRIQQIAGSLL